MSCYYILSTHIEVNACRSLRKWDFYGYNPPFTLPWCRTNEVAIYLTELPSSLR